MANTNDHHPLNMWLAEELAHTMLALEASRLNERNTRERHEAIGQAYEEERTNHRDTNQLLADTFAENTVLRLENERLRADLTIATDVLAQNRDIIRAYRMSAVPLLRPRNLPETFIPTLRRVREEEEERRRVRSNNGQINFL